MIYFDDTGISEKPGLTIVTPTGKREITHVFHDIDGTHSKIRQWQPIMSLVLYYTIRYGLSENFDTPEHIKELITKVGTLKSEETDRFCIESVGLSALTQMEWSIRRAIEEKTILPEQFGMDEAAQKLNSKIIQRIWAGEELFDDLEEPQALSSYLKEYTPRLFQMYEKILNGACRDKNLAIAKENPEAMRIAGSYEFVRFLNELGLKNYLVTGAVISYDENGQPYGGMYEEITSLGYSICPGGDFEAIEGSTWNNKIPKDKVMERLCREEEINPEKVLVIGDGRSEIAAGKKMNAITISILEKDAERLREIHTGLKTNLIISDYTEMELRKLFQK